MAGQWPVDCIKCNVFANSKSGYILEKRVQTGLGNIKNCSQIILIMIGKNRI